MVSSGGLNRFRFRVPLHCCQKIRTELPRLFFFCSDKLDRATFRFRFRIKVPEQVCRAQEQTIHRYSCHIFIMAEGTVDFQVSGFITDENGVILFGPNKGILVHLIDDQGITSVSFHDYDLICDIMWSTLNLHIFYFICNILSYPYHLIS